MRIQHTFMHKLNKFYTLPHVFTKHIKAQTVHLHPTTSSKELLHCLLHPPLRQTSHATLVDRRPWPLRIPNAPVRLGRKEFEWSCPILLMAEIWRSPPGMVYKKLVNNGTNYQPQLVQDFSHQQYHPWFQIAATTKIEAGMCCT